MQKKSQRKSAVKTVENQNFKQCIKLISLNNLIKLIASIINDAVLLARWFH